MRIRFAEPKDEQRCRQMDRHLPPAAFARKIEAQEFVVVEDGERLVGYIRLEFLWGKLPFIGSAWLEPESRGRGVSRALLGFVEAQLREDGHRVLLSSSQVDEAEPKAWHRAVGFRECGVIAGINEGGIGELFFRKEL